MARFQPSAGCSALTFAPGFGAFAEALDEAFEWRAHHPAHQRGVDAHAGAAELDCEVAGHMVQCALGHAVAAFTGHWLAGAQC